jgi:glycosyltransferase involved in cell wall biosynthesis
MSKFLFFETQTMELLATQGKPSGGAAVQTLVWMEGLHQNGHKIFQAKLENDKRVIREAYRKFDLVPLYHKNKGMRIVRWASYRLPKIFFAFSRVKPDFVYESIPFWGSYWISIFCKLLGIKHIIRISNDNLLDKRLRNTASSSHQFFLFLGLRLSDFILAQNDYQYNTLKTKYPNKKILKIHNPIIVDRQHLNSKTEPSGYIAWVANFRYQKNLKLLFEIAQTLPNEEFKIAGNPNSKIDAESKEYVEKLKKLPNVTFMGKIEREDILRFLENAKFLLNTSRYEGFSNTFLEAMIVGTPILTTASVNPDGIVSVYNLGMIYENPNDIAEKVRSLDTRDYREMSKNCNQYIQEYHDHSRLTQKLEEFLGFHLQSEKHEQ